jgi:hypothetical protein
MYCQNCGAQNRDDAAKCNACGASLTNADALLPPGAPQINNYLIPAILSTLCCCPPFGIASIVYAAQVNGLLAAGDIEGAKRSASSAKMWFWIAFALGLTANLIYWGAAIVFGILGAAAQQQQ